MAKKLTATQAFVDEDGREWKVGDTGIYEDLNDFWLRVVEDLGWVTVADVSAALNDADEKVVTGLGGGGAGDASEAKQDVQITLLEQILAANPALDPNTIMKIDETGTNITYLGIAPRGSADGDAVWTLFEIDETVTDLTDILSALNSTWTGRTGASYA